jgi:DNA-binding NarL/FixJ family response regulator
MSKKKQVTKPPRNQTRRQVFIVEDHPVFREGLVQIVGREGDLQICGQAGDAETAYKEILRLKPDLALVDISLPALNGLELIKQLRQAKLDIKLLVVSMHDEALYANRVLRAGGDGYIMKQEDPEEVVDAIRDVLAGHIYVSEEVLMSRGEPVRPSAGEKVEQPLDELSDEELETLELLGCGKNPAQIARDLKTTPKAVGAELRQIRKKLKLATDNELIRFAVCWVEGGTG